MKSLDKGFRHLTRKDKLKELVEYGWLCLLYTSDAADE